MRTVEIKYDFNTVYYSKRMERVPHMIKCDYCVNGIYTKPNGEEVTCPKCEGKGKYDSDNGELINIPTTCCLNKIEIFTINEGDLMIDYIFRDCVTDETIFGTIYETKEECEKDISKDMF